MKNEVFNNDLIEINTLKKKYVFFFSLGLLIVILFLLFIKKEIFYQNVISLNNNKGVLVVDSKYLDYIKEGKIFLNDVSYTYNIDKIEEENDVYVVMVSFPYELKLSVDKYKIILEKENMLTYIIRIIGG